MLIQDNGWDNKKIILQSTGREIIVTDQELDELLNKLEIHDLKNTIAVLTNDLENSNEDISNSIEILEDIVTKTTETISLLRG